jgi:hypothetical protein
MVVVSPEATIAGAARREPTGFGEHSAVSASIARYNLAAARMLTLSNRVVMIGIGLFVLTATAWVLGLLPGAVRLF